MQGTGGQERAGQCPGAFSSLELYFRNISSRPRHTEGMKKASLQFHIQENDYFGTLATVLDLVSQDLRKKGHHNNAETLRRQRDWLVYLQEEYRIEKVVRRGDHNRKVRRSVHLVSSLYGSRATPRNSRDFRDST